MLKPITDYEGVIYIILTTSINTSLVYFVLSKILLKSIFTSDVLYYYYYCCVWRGQYSVARIVNMAPVCRRDLLIMGGYGWGEGENVFFSL